MSDALRNFLQERDPYGHGLEFVVDQHGLEALLKAHEVETAGKYEAELAGLEDELAEARDLECYDEHCSDHDFRCLSCDEELTA